MTVHPLTPVYTPGEPFPFSVTEPAAEITRTTLQQLGVSVQPDDETLAALNRGCRRINSCLRSGNLIPRHEYIVDTIDPESPLEIHNYTGSCPALTFEVNPVEGCHTGCLYCLVTDGVHTNQIRVFQNYPELIARKLKAHCGEDHFFYFSPKTEAFQAPTLQTGIAHRLLRVFIEHFERCPDSRARLFIASKAGIRDLEVRHEGESIFDLFGRLRGRMQFNTSVSIMPAALRMQLEPFAAPLEERLAAVVRCNGSGIMADSALVQPILAPYLTPQIADEFFGQLHAAGIINCKPEFLTVNMENLALIGRMAGTYDADLERRIYDYYISPQNKTHRKQRGRTAPEKPLSKKYLDLLMQSSAKYGISTSICYWVRQQLQISYSEIPEVNRNGFQCLGYQRRLFDHPEQE